MWLVMFLSLFITNLPSHKACICALLNLEAGQKRYAYPRVADIIDEQAGHSTHTCTPPKGWLTRQSNHVNWILYSY
ncbi:hypothetical protein ASPSYDRAFT_790242 [Aspergillus sydowii CBS 593.65]|uniref:Secreted protein n=1 Tax=Aspergillus sydowii CBS 593.65 TaxID=1036612 RepID=A0A1L9TNT1_9EURO|nr:uncharacterized protein ASPSYDRAFT_790242 [Aspergillus sydowii CBS 593.65]OJJ61109.1 hypothetical protein ASPSYDRAFT_790242 [Aspergillus sydowii CBS 593.65]